jgi:thiol-disulfide isomerase/thioredoxin
VKRTLALLASLAAVGCGSNAPEVPDDLLGGSSGCGAPNYPSADLGAEPGSVLENACFVGYRAPERVLPADSSRETIAFSDYYDPAGTKGVSLILVNTAAIWCAACVSEHRTLPDYQRELGPEGLVIFTTLFQDAKRDPATLADVERWVDNFGTNFPIVTDPELALIAYSPPELAPLNMVIDARTMKILRKFVGDQGSVMWPYIETELRSRGRAR